MRQSPEPEDWFDEHAPEVPPPVEPARGNGDERSRKTPRFPLVAFDDVVMSTTAVYVVKDLIPRAGLVIVWGAPKCGKSFWLFDMMMHIALGWSYRGLRVKQGLVVYCVLEGAQGFRRRIEAFRCTRPNSKGAPFYLMSVSLDLIRDHRALIASIRSQLPENISLAAVAIDTLNRSLVGSESSDEDMTAYVRAADSIVGAFDCVVPIVHHCGHNGERPRGHSSLLGAADVQISVKRDASDNIVATVENAKDGAVGLEIVSRLVPVEIGVDDDSDPVLSCVIEPVDGLAATTTPGPKKSAARSEIDVLKVELLAAYDRLADGLPTSPGFDGAAVRKLSVDKLRDELKSRGFLEISDSGGLTAAARKQFQRAKAALLAAPKPHLFEKAGLIWK